MGEPSHQLTLNTGYKYHYFMVFETKPINGALTPSEALKLINDL
jgi:type III restriction enzyme